jgi:hypothetical protein
MIILGRVVASLRRSLLTQRPLDLAQSLSTPEVHDFVGDCLVMEKAMKQINLRKVAIATSTFAFATLLSFGWSGQNGVSVSVESAQARIGRPLTPVSVAGVARRHDRRAMYGAGYGYGAGVVGAGVAGAVAVGAAAAGAGPYYGGWGRPYAGDRLYVSPAPAVAASDGLPWYAVRAYYNDGPWYGYGGWADYRARNAIICDPGTDIKGGDGVLYLCQ